MNTDELDFTTRTYNCLKRAGIDTLEQLQSKTEEELHQVKNLNQKCINEIKEKLRQFKPPDFLHHRPDYTKIKRCHECEYSDCKGFCKNFMLYAHLRNGCLKDQEAAG
ncbi:MAG: DNA-directed RNA polymerase subunit alpha C-terminal domain-containing protein [Anaerocolumna sp.]